MKTFPKRLIISGVGLAGVAGLATLGVGGTSAEFTSATVSPTYSLTNGSVNLTGTAGTDSGIVGSQGNIAPGDTVSHTYNLSYNGSLNAWVGLDTLLVSTIDTSGAPGTTPFANWGNAPTDYLYQVSANNAPTTAPWQGSILSSNYASVARASEVTCPATFDGQTVPTSLTVINPTTGHNQTVSSVFCYLSPRVLVPFENADGTAHAALTETVSNGTTQTETGAWPAGNVTASTLPVAVSLGLCDPTINSTGNPTAYQSVAWNKGCNIANVPSAYQGQAEDVLIGATAVAARNNTNATNNGPQGFNPSAYLPGPTGIWG